MTTDQSGTTRPAEVKATAEAMMRITHQVMIKLFEDLMPAGFTIYKIDEYDPERHTAPNLWLEKRDNPKARYLAILVSDTASVPALGETVTDAITASIAKIEAMQGTVKQ